mgnify:CR=1 FL=1
MELMACHKCKRTVEITRDADGKFTVPEGWIVLELLAFGTALPKESGAQPL